MEIPKMWCIVCKRFVRPYLQVSSHEWGGWYCGHHTIEELKAAQPALALDAPQAAIESDKSGAAHQ